MQLKSSTKIRQIRDVLFEVELETNEVISTIIKNNKKWEELEITPLYQNIEAEDVMIWVMVQLHW